MLDWPGLGVSHRGSTTFVSTSIYFHSASWPRIGRPRKSPGWTFSFGSSAWDVEPQWIGPSWGFASREHGISFHSDLYSPSGSWPRIVALLMDRGTDRWQGCGASGALPKDSKSSARVHLP